MTLPSYLLLIVNHRSHKNLQGRLKIVSNHFDTPTQCVQKNASPSGGILEKMSP